MKKNLAVDYQSERSYSEPSLEERVSILSIHLDNSPLAVIEWDADFRIKRWSGKAENIFGWTTEEVLGKSTLDLGIIYDDDYQVVQNKKKQMNDESSIHYVSLNRNLTKDGRLIYCEWYNSVVYNEEGKISSIMSQVLDVTNRKMAEIELVTLNANQDALLNNREESIWSVDSNYCLIFCNRFFINKILEAYHIDLSNGMNMLTILPPEISSFWKSKYDLVFSGEKVQFEFSECMNGVNHFYNVVISPIIFQETISGVTVSAIDITERKKQELIQSLIYQISTITLSSKTLEQCMDLIRNELGSIMDTTNFFLALYDKETEMLKFPYFEDEHEKLTSLPAKNTLTRYVLTTGKPLLANAERLRNLAESGCFTLTRVKALCWLGMPIQVEEIALGALVLQSYSSENAITQSDLKVLEFIVDQIGMVIQRKKSEENLNLALEKAKESDRLKSAFLANMSHEIRTPMNGILGFSQLLKEPGLSGEQQQEYIDIIERSGLRMLNIINDIIDISRIEAGLIQVNLGETNVNDQITYIFDFFKVEAKNKCLQLTCTKEFPGEEVIILTDREKLYAVLFNLVKNALKFTGNGSIDFGYVSKNPNEILFYVKDTGIGIPPDRLAAVFERFIQADITNKMAQQGAGLGLAISKAYVEILGGKIWVESEEGVGSTFYFTLPKQIKQVNEVAERVADSHSKPSSTFKKLKILIAEDDENSELFLKLIVEDFSKEILIAHNGQEAVEMCREFPTIDLVLMDLQMPLMNGLEATRQIRHFNKNIIIIAQTAFGLSGDREKALESGCTDYISKPIKKEKLWEIIQKYL